MMWVAFKNAVDLCYYNTSSQRWRPLGLLQYTPIPALVDFWGPPRHCPTTFHLPFGCLPHDLVCTVFCAFHNWHTSLRVHWYLPDVFLCCRVSLCFYFPLRNATNGTIRNRPPIRLGVNAPFSKINFVRRSLHRELYLINTYESSRSRFYIFRSHLKSLVRLYACLSLFEFLLNAVHFYVVFNENKL